MSNLSNKLKKLSEQGFSHVETFLVMIVVIAIASVGAYVIKHNESHAGSGCSTGVYSDGSSGTCVKDIQILVNFYNSNKLAKYTPLALDGDFGPLTKAAVQQFQSSSNLAKDGVVGQDTWKALCLPSSPPKTTTVAYKAAILGACVGTDKTGTTLPKNGTGSGAGSSGSTASSTTTTTLSSTNSSAKQVTTTQVGYIAFKTIVGSPIDTIGYDNIKITQEGKDGTITTVKVNGKVTSTKTVAPINQKEEYGDSIIYEYGRAFPKGIGFVNLGNSKSVALYNEATAWFRGSLYTPLSQDPNSGYGGDFIITACYSSSQAEIWAHALNTHGTNYNNNSDVTLNSYYHTSGGGIATGNYSETWTNNVSTSGQVVDTAAKDNPSTTTAWVRVGIPAGSGGNVQTPPIILSKLPACLSNTYGT